MIQMYNTEKLVNLLIEKNWRISAAESCTGGMFAAGIVDVPNASKVFDASFVTYAEWAKSKFVSVNEETIEKFTVVSNEVALQMAKGAAIETCAQVGVGITGIAGPAGGTQENPVGTVCFGFVVDSVEYCIKKCFGNIGRSAVRALSVDFAVNTLIEIIEKGNIE